MANVHTKLDEKIAIQSFSNTFEQMANFVAVAETGNPSETIKGLIKLCFVECPSDKFYSSQQLVEAVSTLFGVNIPNHQMQTALERLISEGILLCPNSSNLLLKPEIAIEVKTRSQEAKELESKVKEKWLDKVTKKYPNITPEETWQTLRKYLCKAFRRHGIQAAALINPDIEKAADYTESLGNLLNSSLNSTITDEQKENTRNAVINFLSEISIDPDRAKYITQLADGAFNFYSLEVSPELSKKIKKKLNELTIFLDTNFLFGILDLHYNAHVGISRELIRAIKLHRLPFKVRFHESTFREMRSTISYYGGLLRSRHWSKSMSKVAVESGYLSGIEQKFHEKNLECSINPDDFLRPYEHLDVILKDKDITIYRSQMDRLSERTALHNEYEEFLKAHGRDDKTYETIEHDVTVLDAVHQLRSSSSYSLDAGALFISCDGLLYQFDWERSRRENNQTCVLFPNIFWQVLRPFIPSNGDFDKSFAETFALPEFRTIGSGANKACSKMISIIAGYKNVPEETALNMLSNGTLIKRLSSIKDDKEFIECVEAEFVRQNSILIEEKAALSKQIEKEKREKADNDREYNKKIKMIESQKAKLEKSLTEAKAQVEKHRKKVKETKAIIKSSVEQSGIKTKDSQEEKRKIVQLERHDTKMSIFAAILFGSLLIILFEFCIYFFKWDWIINHQHKLTLEVACGVILMFTPLSIFDKKRRKTYLLLGVVDVLFIIINNLS